MRICVFCGVMLLIILAGYAASVHADDDPAETTPVPAFLKDGIELTGVDNPIDTVNGKRTVKDSDFDRTDTAHQWTIQNDTLTVKDFTLFEDENIGPITYGYARTLEIKNSTVDFDAGAFIFVNPNADDAFGLSLVNSTVTFKWSGQSMNEWFGSLDNGQKSKYNTENKKELGYRQTVFGGVVSAPINDSLDNIDLQLNVLVDNSTIRFDITVDDPAGTWFIDQYNVRINGDVSAEVTKGTVAARSIDDIAITDGESSKSNLIKTGSGSLIIGTAKQETPAGEEPAEETGNLNIGGKLDVQAGSVVLGDREAAGSDKATDDYIPTNHSVGSINIAADATLDVTHHSLVNITGKNTGENEYDMTVEGTLRVAASSGTGIGKLDFEADDLIRKDDNGNAERTTVFVNGGTVEIYKGDLSKKGDQSEIEIFRADTLDTVIGRDGGTIVVDEDTVFQSGNIRVVQPAAGETDPAIIRKTGAGTYQVNSVQLQNGTFSIEEGTVDFLGTINVTLNAKNENIADWVGSEITLSKKENEDGTPVDGTTPTARFYNSVYVKKLNVGAGTEVQVIKEGTANVTQVFDTINIAGTYTGAKWEEEVTNGDESVTIRYGNDLVVHNGGTVTGPIKNIGLLVLGGYEQKENDPKPNALIFSGTAESPVTHTMIGLEIGSKQTLDLQAYAMIQLTDDDSFGVRINEGGMLKVEAAEKTGIYRGELDSLEPTYLVSNGGTIHIYSNSDLAEPITFTADSVNAVIGFNENKIRVDKGITFVSGMVMSGLRLNSQGIPERGNGSVLKEGAGTWSTESMDIAGNFSLQEGHVFFRNENANSVNSLGSLTVAAGTTLSAKGNLTVYGSSTIAGTVETAGKFTFGRDPADATVGVPVSTLTLDVSSETDYAKITAGSFDFEDNVRIRVVAPGKGTLTGVLSVTEGNAFTPVLLDAVQNKTLDTALVSSTWSFATNESGTDDKTKLDLSYESISVKAFTAKSGLSGTNYAAVAAMLDKLSSEPESSSDTEAKNTKTYLLRAETNDVINYQEWWDKLSKLQDTDMRAAIQQVASGELAGNAMRAAMSDPFQKIFRHLDNELSSPFSSYRGQVRGQSAANRGNTWFTTYGQSESSDRDAHTMDGYDLTKWGILVGSDFNIGNYARLGAVFGYSAPTVKNVLGKITSDDILLGAYLRHSLGASLQSNLMFGVGFQGYDYKGSGTGATMDGDSLYFSWEISRTFGNQNVKLMPLLALDYQSASMDGFDVNGSLGTVNITPGDASALNLRFGLLGEFSRFHARVQYSRQLSGDDYVSSGTVLGSASAQIRSVQWGKNWFNLGIGGNIVDTAHFKLSADYDLNTNSDTISHIGSLGAMLKW